LRIVGYLSLNTYLCRVLSRNITLPDIVHALDTSRTAVFYGGRTDSYVAIVKLEDTFWGNVLPIPPGTYNTHNQFNMSQDALVRFPEAD
jgi:hypothetical protein